MTEQECLGIIHQAAREAIEKKRDELIGGKDMHWEIGHTTTLKTRDEDNKVKNTNTIATRKIL
jgi:hypothetical protein